MASEESVMLVIRASRPNFRNNFDKLAFAVHAFFLSSGFVLISAGPPAFADDPSSSSSSSEEVGIDSWNEVDDEYAFMYKNPKKDNKKVLLKCLVMGDKLMVDALSDGAPEPVNLEIDVDEFATETVGGDYDAQFKNLGKLVSSLKSDVLSKLDGSPAGGPASGTSRLSAEEPNRNIDGSASFQELHRGLSAEEPNRNLDGSASFQEPHRGFVGPPVNPMGASDLYPGPGAGMYPSRGDLGGGSMLIGPEDPRWFGGGGFPGIAGGPGGLGVPPGARFDPYGPPGVPGFESDGRFPRGPVPGRGTRPRGRIHPDLEQPGSGGFDYI